MNNRFQNRNNNYRSDDNRRPYGRNNYHRNGYNDRSRGQSDRSDQSEWRSDSREFHNGNRSEPRYQSGQSGATTHLPGIPVTRNQCSTPFASKETKVDTSCSNGSGDKSCEQQSVENLSNQMSQIDLKVKDIDTSPEVVPNDTKEVKESAPLEQKTGSESESKDKTGKVEPKNVANNYEVRRYSVGSGYRGQYNRTFQRKPDSQQLNGHKFERFNNYNNKMQAIDPKSFNRGLKKYTNNDFIANYVPMNAYAPNMCDTIAPLSQYLFQNPYYPTYGYGFPTQMMAPNGSDMSNDLANHRKHNEVDRNGKVPEPTASPDIMGYPSQFVPFEPSPGMPEPPYYYGNIVPYNTGKEIVYYFHSYLPPNIAPLLLKVDPATGLPILPSNCLTTVINCLSY